MKGLLRIAVIFVSVPLAYFAAMYAESFTGVPLANGAKEGTPLTELAFFTVFPLTLIAVLIFGNIP